MSEPPDQKELKRKLFMIVGGIMALVVLVWALVLYPLSTDKASESSGAETETFLKGVDGARNDLDMQLKQREKEKQESINQQPQEEQKDEVDTPRLPDVVKPRAPQKEPE